VLKNVGLSGVVIRRRPEKDSEDVVHVLAVQMQELSSSNDVRALECFHFKEVYVVNGINLPSAVDYVTDFVVVGWTISPTLNIFSNLVGF
tara:strand:+ start:227 stop:496 length:270 start_codon:yes stop_codon:yes gene_type:complete